MFTMFLSNHDHHEGCSSTHFSSSHHHLSMKRSFLDIQIRISEKSGSNEHKMKNTHFCMCSRIFSSAVLCTICEFYVPDIPYTTLCVLMIYILMITLRAVKVILFVLKLIFSFKHHY